MENLIVYPENQKQLSVLKSLLEEMKIRFKSGVEVEELQDWQKKLIDEGIEDIKAGRFTSAEEVSKKARECIK